MFTLTPKTPRTLSGVGSSGRGVGGADRDSHSSFLISQSCSSNHSQPDPQPQRGYLRPQPLRNPPSPHPPPPPRPRAPAPSGRGSGPSPLEWRPGSLGRTPRGGGGWGGPSLLPCVLSASISFQKLAAELEMSPHQHLRLSRLQLQFPQRGQESTGSSSITSLAHPSTPPPTRPSLSTRL